MFSSNIRMRMTHACELLHRYTRRKSVVFPPPELAWLGG